MPAARRIADTQSDFSRKPQEAHVSFATSQAEFDERETEMRTEITVLQFLAYMQLPSIFHCAPVSSTSATAITEFIEQLNERSASADAIMLKIPSDSTTSSANVESINSSEAVSLNLLSVFNGNPKDVIELILRDGNGTAEMPSSTDSNTEYAKGILEINLDETRDELFRALQYEASVQIDALSHEQIRTISEERLRTTLEEVLKRQFGEAKHKSAMNNTTHIKSTTALNYNTTTSEAATLTSQLICQFFVFGTLFGVVCSISTCTCCLHPRGDRRRNVELSGVNPTNVPPPIDYSKPYMLKCDSRGSCYASPLNDDEVPPLPSYTEALSCATKPMPKHHGVSNDATRS